MDRKGKISMEYIVNAFKFTFKHPLLIGILVILCSIPFQAIFYIPFIKTRISVLLSIPAIFLFIYFRAGGYSIIWKSFSGSSHITARLFIRDGKKYFGVFIKVGIIIFLISMIFFIPRWVRPFMKGGKGYRDTTEAFFLTNIPGLIFVSWTIYILPFIYIFDIRRISVVGKGFRFLKEHFKLSIPIIALAIISYAISMAINQIVPLSRPPSIQYRLIQGSNYIIHFYLSIIIFLSAAQILKKFHREEDEAKVCTDAQILKEYHVEEDEEWVCTECDAVVPADATICPRCGADVSEVEDDQLDIKNHNPQQD
jgi:ribosomal protein L40E